jgi:hypothetical protein
MAILDKKAFLSRASQVKEIKLSGDSSVFIRPLPAANFINDEGQSISEDSFHTEKLIIRSLCDADGVPWFNEKDEKTHEVLKIPMDDFNTLALACLEINGLKLADKTATGGGEKN